MNDPQNCISKLYGICIVIIMHVLHILYLYDLYHIILSLWLMSGPTECMYIYTYVCLPDFAVYYYQIVISLTAMSVMTVNPSEVK
jgi:hypothetical protein